MVAKNADIMRLFESLPESARQRYSDIALLGEGGMGISFRARDKKLNRLIAIKIIRKKHAQDKKICERFRREVQLLSRINHPNIVTFFDLNFDERPWYFTMEFIEGSSLDSLLETKLYDEKEILQLGNQLAEGLGAIHDSGILHRDIKPQNIIINEMGRPIIIDFGLATTTGTADLTALTKTGNVVGTTSYLAPELLRGERATKQSDIYQIGVCLYECLVGNVPYDSQTLLAIAMGAQAKVAEKPSTRGIRISEETEEVLLGLISPDPQKRPKTTAILRRQLQSLMDPSVLSASTAQPPIKVDSAPSLPKPVETERHPQKRLKMLATVFLALLLLFVTYTKLNVGKDGHSKTEESLSTKERLSLVTKLIVNAENETKPQELPQMLQEITEHFVKLTEAAVKRHPYPLLPEGDDYWELCRRFGLLTNGAPSFFKPLLLKAKGQKSFTMALRACSQQQDTNMAKAYERAKAALKTLRLETLEKNNVKWDCLHRELNFVDLAQSMGSRGRELSKATLCYWPLHENSLAYRRRFAQKRHSLWVPVEHEVALLLSSIIWQANLSGSANGLLEDLRFPLHLIINSPDLPEATKIRFKQKLSKALAQLPSIKRVVLQNDPGLKRTYWGKVAKFLIKARTRYSAFRRARNGEAKEWLPLLRQSYWHYRLAALGPDIEPQTRCFLLACCKDLIIYGSRVEPVGLGTSLSPMAIGQIGTCQLALLTEPNWQHGKPSIEIEAQAIVYGHRLFKAMNGRLQGAGRPLSKQNDGKPNRFADWRKSKWNTDEGSAWQDILKLIEGAKHKTLSLRILLALYRRVSGDFPMAMFAFEQMNKEVFDLVSQEKTYRAENVRLFLAALNAISEELDTMGDMVNLRSYNESLGKQLLRLKMDKWLSNHGDIILLKHLRTLHLVNEARLVAPQLSSTQRQELKACLNDGSLSDYHYFCSQLLIMTN